MTPNLVALASALLYVLDEHTTSYGEFANIVMAFN